MTREKEIQREKEITGKGGKRTLVLINDDFHTFDYVIEALIEICGHTPEQAEQCAFITHFKGRCGVSSGPYEVVEPKKKALTERHLRVIID